MRRIRGQVRSNVVRMTLTGALALVLPLIPGVAQAAIAPPNSVVSSSIKNGQVKTPDLANGAVKHAKLASGAVNGANVVPNSLGGGQVKELALDFTVLQRRIATACPAGQAIRAITKAGGVVCQGSSGTVTSVDSGTGLTGGPITSSGSLAIASPFRLPQGCANGEVAKSDGSGAWSCATDQDSPGTDWHLGGNAGITGEDFLGTTDSAPLNLSVNRAQALRLEPASDGTNQSPNVIGGIADNIVTDGAYAATIGGGGRSDPADPTKANRVTDNYGTVAGGGNNQAGDAAGEVADHEAATVGGGRSNSATGYSSMIGGGQGNTASASFATVSGGSDNTATGNATIGATVGGGYFNTAGHQSTTVAGGNNNTAGQTGATVGGGDHNTASGPDGTIAGGGGNTASGGSAAVGGGVLNTASGANATVPGGHSNTASGTDSFAAGFRAKANHQGSFVWGDSSNSDVASTAANQFTARASGGVRLFSSSDSTGATAPGVQLFPDTSALGTVGSGAPFDIRVGSGSAGDRGLRLEPASDGSNQSPNVIGGIADNQVANGAYAATIAGGGRRTPSDATTANQVTDSYGTIGGGGDNQAGDGAGTTSDQTYATVGGGVGNTASAGRATVGGGFSNTASGGSATLGGGFSNTASGNASSVGGGDTNLGSAAYTSVAGGRFNVAGGNYGAIGGGYTNTASNDWSTVGGGHSNTADGNSATVAGGGFNIASGVSATVSGGNANTASGFLATVPGGQLSTAAGNYGFAAGHRAKANHQGAFVWADSQTADMASTADNQFIARAGGHFFLQSDSTLDDQGGFLNTSTGAYLSTGGTWTNSSDENLKSRVRDLSARSVLRRVKQLPVNSWEYDAEPGVRHIGPMAQAFYAAFGLGADSKHIASVDADGVSLAATKGLAQVVERQRARLRSQSRRIAVLERAVRHLQGGNK